MTWFDVLNCQSERLTIGWPTFLMFRLTSEVIIFLPFAGKTKKC